MRNSALLRRTGLTVAAAAAFPLALTAAGPAAARVSGISVSTTGSTVSVVTSACTQINGSWGTASLLNSSQANFAQGRQVALSGTSVSQSAAWSGVGPGTYTVIVVCSNQQTAGTQSVIVSAPATPTVTARPSPSRGVMGGLGGAARDYGPVTMGVGAALVGTGVIAGAWFLRRRSKPHRL
ncbi:MULTISPECIES: hypothetical protein [Streptomyces]|uniref:Secreted protein n=2 Tax=Streptomyces TaxID=1883 RepID=A0A2U9NWN9_STRAS|nr:MULTISPECIES: hypothetical protein [Streptomyces]AWT41464.1 hypothetical protein DMT42_03485 [Streptomyces actuosus]MBM4825972.1 hypothetical protein [Streptomyces actuosus]GHF55097.1 hypothetical protein GCM10018783_25140 [Streptomyces griseosporeus]